MKKSILLPLIGLSFFFAGCRGGSASGPGHDDTVVLRKRPDAEVVMSVLYQQQAAEYRALCLQAYNIARNKVARAVRMPAGKDSFAVITDLDETALDNSADEAQLILDSTTYTARSFDDWARAEKAGAVPGAVAFFNYVNDLGRHSRKPIDIFYVSNRDSALTQVTMDNMAQLGFPQITRSHFLFLADRKHPSKEGRREQIEKNHTVILLLGDNLIDLDSTFDSNKRLTEGQRKHRVDSLASYFGDRYIVFPNAIYGDWEGALYNYHYPPLDSAMQIRKDSLHGYR